MLAWVHDMSFASDIDPSTGRVSMTRKTGMNPHFTDLAHACFLENDRRFLQRPGDWYLDESARTLYVVPPENANLADFEIEIPVTDQWLVMVSEPENPVVDVTIEGIRFEYADWFPGKPGSMRWDPKHTGPGRGRSQRPVWQHKPRPTEYPVPPLNSGQSATYLPGSVQMRHVTHCKVQECTFVGSSYYAILAEDGCRNVCIDSCSFDEMGAGAVYLDGSPYCDDPDNQNTNNAILNSTVCNGGQIFQSACGVLATHVAWLRVEHNEIHDLTYSGISVGWQWEFNRGPNRDNRIVGNHIYNIGLNGHLWDMGGIYLLGYQPGTLVEDNVVHNVQCYDFAGWGIYLDEGSSGITVVHNLIWNCFSHCIHEHWGRSNQILFNVLGMGKSGGIALNNEISHAWVEQPRPLTRIEKNIIVTNAGPAMVDHGGILESGGLTRASILMDGNVFWDTNHGLRIWSDAHGEHSLDLDAIRAVGQERSGVVMDPCITYTEDRPLEIQLGFDYNSLGIWLHPERWENAGPIR
jgi:hypothetical protein